MLSCTKYKPRITGIQDNTEYMISVIIPVYNREDFIAEAIESVLRQTYKNIELIVVDDGSTDNTRQVVETFADQVRYVYKPLTTVGETLNCGIEMAKGDYLAFLDSDDCWTKNKLERQIADLQENQNIEAVFGLVRQVHQSQWKVKIQALKVPSEELLVGYVPGTMLIRRESFLRIGYYPSGIEVGESLDWHLRAKDKNLQMKVIPELMLWRRIHTTNMGIIQKANRVDYVRILKKSIDRRRALKES